MNGLKMQVFYNDGEEIVHAHMQEMWIEDRACATHQSVQSPKRKQRMGTHI